MKLLRLWDELPELRNSAGRYYYRKAVITWSRPREWFSDEREFNVPDDWRGHGGLYAMLRSHWRQTDARRVAYIGKAIDFANRLNDQHQHIDIVRRLGRTEISCGRVRFENIRARFGHYLELEDIVKFAVVAHLENKQGMESLPGFRASQRQAMQPWLIVNDGYKFGGLMPKNIIYPAFAIA
ncbi:MAG: hypothetical protein ACYDD1_03095 [Caulobacteraceae bacterium]